MKTLLLIICSMIFSHTSSANMCSDIFNTTVAVSVAEKWSPDQLITYLLTNKNIILQEVNERDATNPLALLDPNRVFPQFRLSWEEADGLYGVITDYVSKRKLLMTPILSRENIGRNFSNDAKLLLLTERVLQNYDRSTMRARIFDIETGKLLHEFPLGFKFEGLGELRSIDISRNFKTAIAFTDQASLVLDMSTNSPRVLSTFRNTSGVMVSPDGQFIIAQNEDTQAVYRVDNSQVTFLFETTLRRNLLSFQHINSRPSRLADTIFSDSGNVLILKTGKYESTAYDVSGDIPKVLSTFPLFFSYTKILTPDGRYLILGRGRKLIVRDMSTGAIVASYKLKLGTNLNDVFISDDITVVHSQNSKYMGLRVPVDVNVGYTRIDNYLLGFGEASLDHFILPMVSPKN